MIRLFILFAFLSTFACHRGERGKPHPKKQTNIKHKMNNRGLSISTDTLSTFELKAKKYGNIHYQIIQIHIMIVDKNDNCIEDRSYLEFFKNKKLIAKIKLPNAGEVSNFGIDKIVETDQGFKVLASWGGGNYFYNLTFVFKYFNRKFYFTNFIQIIDDLNENETKTIYKTIDPSIPIERFRLSQVMGNIGFVRC